jgi:iron complex transport system substrate-binding protein
MGVFAKVGAKPRTNVRGCRWQSIIRNVTSVVRPGCSWLLAFAVCSLLLAACAPTLDNEPRAAADEMPQVVSLAPSITEIIFALDAGDQLLGRSMHCTYPDAAATIPSVGRIDLPDLETLLTLKPDRLILSGLTPIEVEQRIRRLGLPTLRLEHSGLDGLRSDMVTLAETLGRVEEGRALLERWDSVIANVEAAVAASNATPPRVVLLYSMSALYSAGEGSFVGDLITLCGGVNIARKALSPWPQLNREAVLAENPQIILLAMNSDKRSATDQVRFIEQLQADSFWRQIDAVRDGRIHFIPSDWLTIPGPRTLNAIEAIFAALHQKDS